MGRAPCCDKANVKKGPWSPEEDSKLKNYIDKYGTGGNWIALPQKAGLRRCGKSCRLRWLNYLRPNIKHGEFTEDEDRIICTLFANIGTRWSIIASQLPGRTDNDIKNYWNTKLKKKLLGSMVPPKGTKFNSQSHTYPSSSSLHHQTLTPPSLYPTTSLSSHHLFQTQQDMMSLVGPTTQYYVEENNNNNLLVFGSQDQTSCSSSDNNGSYYSQTRRVDQIINIKQEHHHRNQQMGFVQSFVSNNGFPERSSLGYNGIDNYDQKEEGYFGEITFDDDIESFKQLISSNSYGGIDDYEKKQVMDMI